MSRQGKPVRGGRWLLGGLAGALIAYAAWEIFSRYGALDAGQAEAIVLGLLLFIAGTALLAFLLVLIVKLVQRIGHRRRPTLLDEDDA